MNRRDFLKTASAAGGTAAVEPLLSPFASAAELKQQNTEPERLGATHMPFLATELRCESAVNPLGIDVAKPLLSWNLKSSERGQCQTAYQILVASDESKLREGSADIWDSGKVASDQSTQVAYDGPALTSRRRCFWRVRAWDKGGKDSPYSEPAWWEMAFLSPQDWNAQWVGCCNNWPGRAFYFRGDFKVSKTVERARVYVTGLGYHELRLNGSKIGDHVLDPGVTDYAKRILYSTYDVTDKIQNGPNTIGVIVGNGWYGVPRLILQCEIAYTDGSVDTIHTHQGFNQGHGRWLVTSGPILANSIYDGETYDARLEKDGWDASADASKIKKMPINRLEGWAGLHSVPVPGGVLRAQAVDPIKVVDTLRLKRITEPKPGVFEVDFGQNMAGWAQINVSGPRGTRVVLKFGERLLKDGTIDQTNLFTAAATDVYILKGNGAESWEPRFTYHGFRYVQVEGFPGRPTLDTLTAKVVRSSVIPVGKIETSNDLINRIQNMVWWTEASNLYSIPTDCPQRSERMGWMNDLTVRAEEAIYNFDMSRFFPKFLDDCSDMQRADGAITDTAPFGWGSVPGDPVEVSYLLLGWFAYLHYGDTHTLAGHFDGFKAWTDYLRSRTKDNIVTYGYYGDWSPPKAFAVTGSKGSGAESRYTPRELMSTGSLYYDAVLVSRMAGVLGKEREQDEYARIAKSVAEAFNERYWNEAVGGYGPVTAHNQAVDSFALFLGIVPEPRVHRVVADLVKAVHANDDHLTTGNLCTKYVLESLSKHGHTDLALKIALQETYPSWGYMLANAATTLWERWENLTGPGMNSHNHPMLGSVSSWFYKHLGGIHCDPDVPGFKHMFICPETPAGLNWVHAEYMSPYGLIRSYWKKEDGKTVFNVAVPVNATAGICLPVGGEQHVTVGGKEASTATGVVLGKVRNGRRVFEVGSGEYEFVLS